MTLLTHIREAITSLRSTRVRTGLTTLGIIIGVLSITLVLSLGEGSKRSLTQQIVELDSGIIIARPGGADQRSIWTGYGPFTTSSASMLMHR